MDIHNLLGLDKIDNIEHVENYLDILCDFRLISTRGHTSCSKMFKIETNLDLKEALVKDVLVKEDLVNEALVLVKQTILKEQDLKEQISKDSFVNELLAKLEFDQKEKLDTSFNNFFENKKIIDLQEKILVYSDFFLEKGLNLLYFNFKILNNETDSKKIKVCLNVGLFKINMSKEKKQLLIDNQNSLSKLRELVSVMDKKAIMDQYRFETLIKKK